MSRKQILIFLVAVIVVSALSAVLGYWRGASQSKTPLSVSEAVENGKESGVGCVDFRQAGGHTGENGCVSGRVLRVYTSRSGSTFLDFCEDYRSCPFTSVIFASDRKNFGNIGTLEGRRIDIVGEIVTYGGRAEIVIHSPDQIRESQ